MSSPPTSTIDRHAEQLRARLVEDLRERGLLSDPRVEQALFAVPRHVFVPSASVDEAYSDQTVHTKHDASGAISGASAPNIVAMMLEQLAVEPGHNVLEIGAGTGYNAALLGHLVGPTGRVTTIDVDDDIVTSAREHLAAARAENVEVVVGDGALGHPAHAPYDRLIATVGTAELPKAWLEQTSPHGRLVVPVRIRGGVTRSIAFARTGDTWTSVDSQLCGFMPLRASVAADPRRTIDLLDGAAHLHVYADQDVDARLASQVLARPATEVWTGATFVKGETLEFVWLWLACALPNSISWMEVERRAVEAGVLRPATSGGSTATVEGDSLAYLTMRASGDAYELGVIGHGSRGKDLAEAVAEAIGGWTRYRDHRLTFEFHPSAEVTPRRPGQYVVSRRSGSLVVTWTP